MRLKGDKRSAVWDEGLFYAGCRLRWGWVHAHAGIGEYFVLYAGISAADLFGNAGLKLPGMPGVLVEDDAGIETIVELIKSPPVAPVCYFSRYNVPQDIIEGYYGTVDADANAGNIFDRYSSACVPGFKFEKGMRIVTLNVFSPRSPETVRPLFNAHSVFQMIVTAEDPAYQGGPVAGKDQVGLWDYINWDHHWDLKSEWMYRDGATLEPGYSFDPFEAYGR